ncbi:MAG: 3'(2'),5'-bisphosphate nucleotidase CysQ [Spirochaetaceae bacterium]
MSTNTPPNNSGAGDYAAYLQAALRAALPASDAVLRIYGEENWDVEQKADDSPLTRADREAHEVIAGVLEAETPEVPILSEEGAHHPFETRRTWHRLWVVDPLDGTKEFLSRNGEFTVNVALVEDGEPVLGVVTVPALDTYYVAFRGGGAYRASRADLEAVLDAAAADAGTDTAGDAAATGDTAAGKAAAATSSPAPARVLSERALRLSATQAAADAGAERGPEGPGGGRGSRQAPVRVVASRSHLNAETEEFIEELRRRFGEVALVQAGSAVKLCRVAEGEADYYPRLAPTMEWDTAAGDAVVREAGGRVLRVPEGDRAAAAAGRAADGNAPGRATAGNAPTETPLRYNKEDLHNPYFVAVGRGYTL